MTAGGFKAELDVTEAMRRTAREIPPESRQKLHNLLHKSGRS
jgi:hypothetical protein